MKSPTLSDVARSAGVSYATADRVINNRGNVAQKSVRKVNEAVSSLGYVRNVAAANLSRRRTLRLALLLPHGPNAFFQRMRHQLDAMRGPLQADQVSVEIIEVAAFKINALCDGLWSMVDAGFDGIAVVGLQSPMLEAPLRKLKEQGVAIVGLVSDLPRDHRAAYIGIDNVAAGRTAGRLMGNSHAGNEGVVQIIAGSPDAQDHRDRIAGFREIMRADYPSIHLPAPIMTRDDPQATQEAMAQVLSAAFTVTGVYNVGAGNDGLIPALASGTKAPRPVSILHELVPQSRQALMDKHIDFVIDQAADQEITHALTLLKALIEARPVPPLADLVPTIYVRENLPQDAISPHMKGT